MKAKSMMTEVEIKEKLKKVKICKIHKIKYVGERCPVCTNAKK